jgi:hypothetical protein
MRIVSKIKVFQKVKGSQSYRLRNNFPAPVEHVVIRRFGATRDLSGVAPIGRSGRGSTQHEPSPKPLEAPFEC